MAKVKLVIEGMMCGGCTKSIQDRLEKEKNINEVEVSLDDKTAIINYDNMEIDEISNIIVDLGFDVIEKQPC